MVDILIVAGTRPEAIKIYPVLNELRKTNVEVRFVWSGQHYDYEMSRIFFEELGLPTPDEFLEVIPGDSIASQVSELLSSIAICIKRYDPKYVYALGDTNTTLATALASKYLSKPFIHDEAGMRSFDTTMIEELNRRIADMVAHTRLAPSTVAVLNLLREHMPLERIWLVGSTVVDTLKYAIHRLRRDVLSRYNLDEGMFILVTIHRRENLTIERLTKIVYILLRIADEYPQYKLFIPLHPHTRIKLVEYDLLYKLRHRPNVVISKPLGYTEFISLLKSALIVITDSGGVQEEAFLMGKPTITLRPSTEWIETILCGCNFLTDLNVDAILKVMNLVHNSDLKCVSYIHNLERCPIGDGKAGARIARIIRILLESETMSSPLIYMNDLKKELETFAKMDLKAHIADDVREKMMRLINVDWNRIDRLIHMLSGVAPYHG